MQKFNKAIVKMVATLLVAVLFIGATPAITQGSNDITVTIDGVQINFPEQNPVIVEGRTLVPVREVFEHLGFTPVWDSQLRTATLTRSDYTIVLAIDSEVFTTNGVNHVAEVPAQIVNNATMLPLRAPLESVGYTLSWNSATRTVIITTGRPAAQVTDPVEATEPATEAATEPTTEPAQEPATEPTEPATEAATEAPTEAATTAPAGNVSSFQQILDNFSAQLRAATPGLVADFRAAAADVTDIMVLTDLSIEFTAILAEISVDGTLEMAALMVSGVGNMDIYMEYAERLTAVYLEEAARISDVFLELSMALFSF